MLRIAWWAAITLLIVESCTKEPVVSLEAAGSFVVQFPSTDLCDDELLAIVSNGVSSDTLLFYVFPEVDTIYAYRFGTSFPIYRAGITKSSRRRLMYDCDMQQVIMLSEESLRTDDRRYLDYFTPSLAHLKTDTIQKPVDESGMTYNFERGSVLAGNKLTVGVSAEITVTEGHLEKYSIAQLDLNTKKWKFIHRFPEQMRADRKRFYASPMIAARQSRTASIYFRYTLSDSIYRILPDGSVENLFSSIVPGVDLHTRLTVPESGLFDSFITEPTFICYSHLDSEDLHLTVLKERQSERLPDGRLASYDSAPSSLVVTSVRGTGVLRLPEGHSAFSFVIGDKIAAYQGHGKNHKPGRIVYSLFRLRVN